MYAYELPSEALLPTVRRSDSPDELVRQEKLQQVKRQRTLSLKEIENTRTTAARVREKLLREGLRERAEMAEEEGEEPRGMAETAEGEGLREEKLTREPLRGGRGEEVMEEESGVTAAKRRRVEAEEPGSEVNGASGLVEKRDGGVAAPGDPVGGARGSEDVEDMDVRRLEDSDERSNSYIDPNNRNTSLQPQQPYLYAVHRRMVSVRLHMSFSDYSTCTYVHVHVHVSCTGRDSYRKGGGPSPPNIGSLPKEFLRKF